MTVGRLTLAVVMSITGAQAAAAFERCPSLASSPGLATDLQQMALLRAPVRHHDVAVEVTLVTPSSSESLIPFATTQQRRRIVVLTPAFAEIACEVVLAQYLALESDETGLSDSAKIAALCLDAKKTQRVCSALFAAELKRRYGRLWQSLSEEHHNVAYGIFEATLNQIVMHEYAHHYLNHFDRLSSKKVSRVAAEFEADLFAMINGVQAGEPVSAMYYFFNPLAHVEEHTSKWATPDYESSVCRANNVDNITGAVGILPAVIVDAAYGGGLVFTRNSPTTVRSAAAEVLRKPKGEPRQTCAQMAAVTLDQLTREVGQVYTRIEPDLELMFSESSQVDIARSNRLIGDLSALALNLQYADGIAAKAVALFLRKWGLRDRDLAPLMGQVDRLLLDPERSAGLLSEDAGRILQAQGLSFLQERTDLPSNVRLDRGQSLLQEAVDYNPAQSEAWMNLAFVWLKRGDCPTAAKQAERALATYTGDDVESTRGFVALVRQFASSPEKCREAARFSPYPGL